MGTSFLRICAEAMPMLRINIASTELGVSRRDILADCCLEANATLD